MNENVGETENYLLAGDSPINELLEELKTNEVDISECINKSCPGLKNANEYSLEAAKAALCNGDAVIEKHPKTHKIRLIPPEQKSRSWAKTEPQTEDWGSYYQPKVKDVLVRSKTYLYSSMKIPNGMSPLLELAHLDFIKSANRFDNIAGHENSWLNKRLPKELSGRKFLVINIQLSSMSCNLVQYFVFDESGSTGCTWVDKMLEDFVKGSDEFRNQRLKLIPVIVDGPWMVKKTVPEKPCIIGTKVNQRYWEGDNYFEIDIEADSSKLAKGILRLLKNYKNYSVNLMWMLEAKLTSELPEKILAAAHVAYPDYAKAVRL